MIYISEYGKMLDMIQSFILQFNPEYKDQSRNRYGIEWVRSYCEEPNRDLIIFFKAQDNKARSMAEILFSQEGDELVGASVDGYLSTVFTKEKIQDYLTEYYFDCKYEETTLEKLHTMLDDNDFTDEIRYFLLSFYIDSDRFTKLLHTQMVGRYQMMEHCHAENQALIVNAQSELVPEIFMEMDREIWDIVTEYDQITYSICLIADTKIERRGLGVKNGENVCFTLGIHWKEKMLMISRRNKIDITLFGKILSEPNRMKIIEYLLENEEITIAQAVEYLEASVTATTYHLNMMFGAKMLRARYEGRKIFYSLQKDYFEIAIGMLRELVDRM